MEHLLTKGFMKASDYLLKNYYLKENIDISNEIKKTVVVHKNRMDALVKMISHVKKPLM
jgi:hypothetical protein